jgi:hypothetical protein
MPETERDPAAVREYERALAEVAEHRVLDEAEDVIARAWIAELDAMRHAGLRLAMVTRVAERVARESLHQAQRHGPPAELPRAHARFAATEVRTAERLGHANALLTSVSVLGEGALAASG